jgi:ABC-type Mn2+/Zn2+ transport system permease subunit
MEMLDYPFMRLALLMGLVLGVLFSLMGIFVVTRGMSFFSDFVAHAAILGGALALLVGVDSSLFLIPYSVLLAFAVASVWNAFPLSRDTVLGVFYGGAVAAGIILISVGGLGQQSLVRFLFGDILLIRASDLWLSLGLLAAFLAFLSLNMRRLLKATFLPEVSQAEGISVKRYDHALIALMAVTIAVSIKLIGVLLANSMVVIPAASAKALSRSFRQFLVLAPLMGAASFTAGIALSYYLNTPSGPTVIASAFSLFVLSLVLGRLRRA